jgi:hypothetical protein
MKAIYGGEEGWFNVRGNFFRPGPATSHLDGEWLEISTSKTTSMVPGNFFIDGNVYDVSAVKKGNYNGNLPDMANIVSQEQEYKRVSEPQPFEIHFGLDVQDACKAYKAVLKNAGASKRRDVIDRRIIKEVKKGIATYPGSLSGLPGIIDSETDIRQH